MPWNLQRYFGRLIGTIPAKTLPSFWSRWMEHIVQYKNQRKDSWCVSLFIKHEWNGLSVLRFPDAPDKSPHQSLHESNCNSNIKSEDGRVIINCSKSTWLQTMIQSCAQHAPRCLNLTMFTQGALDTSYRLQVPGIGDNGGISNSTQHWLTRNGNGLPWLNQ